MDSFFAPGSQGAGILLIAKVTFYLASRCHPCNTLSPLSSSSLFLHCFIPSSLHALLYSILKILFDSMFPSNNYPISLSYATKVLERVVYTSFLQSSISIHLDKFYFILGNKFYFLAIKFPSLEAKIMISFLHNYFRDNL